MNNLSNIHFLAAIKFISNNLTDPNLSTANQTVLKKVKSYETTRPIWLSVAMLMWHIPRVMLMLTYFKIKQKLNG